MDTAKEKPLGVQISMMVLDKLLLGVIILGVGYLFNLQLQKRQTVTSYQQKIFDTRLAAYSSILKEAKKTYEITKDYYITDTTKSNSKTLASIRQKWKQMGSGWGGAGGSWTDIDQVAEQLLKMDSVRVENDFYFSDEIRVNINLFITTITNDIDNQFKKMLNKEPFKAGEEYERLMNVYYKLVQSIKERLKIDKIELG